MEELNYPLNIIRSKYILQHIFNYLERHKKLILSNYNKALQYKLKLSIEDYKDETKIIKICGFNGYGKEYNKFSKKLIFEGNYLNGEKNGKGIEYFSNGVKKIEGEYLNGKIYEGIQYDEKGNELFKIQNGEKKEIFDNGIIKFKGEYLNDKKWNGKGYDYNGNEIYEIKEGKGYVKEFYSDGSLLFEGEYLNGEKIGKGIEYLHGKLIFKGEYLNGERNGKGKEYFDNGLIKFEGEYKYDSIWNGKGYDYNGKEQFEIKEGTGNIIIYNFQGKLISKFLYMNGLKLLNLDYMNTIPFSEIHTCTDVYSNGSLKLIDDRIFKEYNHDELIFEGEYLNGERNGKGKEYFYGELIFEGEYMDGKRNGLGKEYYINNKIKFEGEYKNGKINGKGKEYDYFGRLIFEGEYINNKRWNGKIYKYSNYNFSKYIYLIPSIFFSKYGNNVPTFIKKEYYNRYRITSSCCKYSKY